MRPPPTKVIYMYAAVAAILTLTAMFIINHNLSVDANRGNFIFKETVAKKLSVETDVDLVTYFKFIPNDIRDCKDLFAGTAKKFPDAVQDALNKHSEAIKRKSLTILESHSIKYTEEALVYVKLAQLPFVRTVCETGFNGGHSTTLWLSANNKTNVYSFDLGQHPYARPMADYLYTAYQGRLKVTWGDSRQTMPKFIQENPSVKCDLMIIDGGHETDVCASDFENFKKLASPINMILIDNYPDSRFGFKEKVGNCWEPRKKKGEIAEVMKCGYGYNSGKPKQGFSFGRIIL